jgi:hypothetical protein
VTFRLRWNLQWNVKGVAMHPFCVAEDYDYEGQRRHPLLLQQGKKPILLEVLITCERFGHATIAMTIRDVQSVSDHALSTYR